VASLSDGHSPSPSALFARRLMHYCSAEVDSVTSARSSVAAPRAISAPSRPSFSFQHHLKPRPNPAPIQSTTRSSWLWHAEQERLRREELEQDLQDSLEELSEGIDVLQILEQAYDRTIKAHVAPPSSSSQLPTRDSADPLSAPHPPDSASQAPASPQMSTENVPLMSGSSTALLAVLDHAPRHQTGSTILAKPPHPSSAEAPPSTLPTAETSSATPSGPTIVNYAAGTLHPSITLDDKSDDCDAVIRVAHIGDCMGMLVRGEEIVWRSEEMWWDVSDR